MFTEEIVARNQSSWLRFSSPIWGIVGLVSIINMLQVYPLRPFRFTPVIYHASFSTTVGTARIAQLVLWLSVLGDWEILVWFLVGARDVSAVQRIQTECWVLPSFLCSGYKGLFFLGVKWWGMKQTFHFNLYSVQRLFETSDLALLRVLISCCAAAGSVNTLAVLWHLSCNKVKQRVTAIDRNLHQDCSDNPRSWVKPMVARK